MNSITSLNTNRYNQNVQFKGRLPIGRISLRQRQANAEIISNILSIDKADAFKLTKHASNEKLYLLRHLTDKYNLDNFYRKLGEKDDTQLVKKMYKAVRSPKDLHHELISHYPGSLNSLSRIFAGINNRRNALNFADKVNNEILLNTPSAYTDLLPELLESKHSNKYVRNYNKYKSYLVLNRDNKDVVKNLDEMVESGSYNRKKYDRIIENEKLMQEFSIPETENFNAKNFVENYSEVRSRFFKFCAYHFYIDRKTLNAGADKILREMYNTCTKQNYKLRLDIANKIRNLSVSHVSPEFQVNQMKELNDLYNTVDNDKYARKFVKNILKDRKTSGAISVNSINQILSLVPTVKLSIFRANAKKIINNTSGKERLKAMLTELEKPSYDTRLSRINSRMPEEYGFLGRETQVQKLANGIRNGINILRYGRYRHLETPVDINSIVDADEKVMAMKLSKAKKGKDAQNNETISAKAAAEVLEPKEAKLDKTEMTEDAKRAIKNVKATFNQPVDYKRLAESYITEMPTAESHNKKQSLYNDLFGREMLSQEMREKVANLASRLHAPVNYAKVIENLLPENLSEEQYNNRYNDLKKAFSTKYVARQNVLAYVQKKLGAKTLRTQKDAYQAKATKMKLAMLPEIFASIADTRKADRLVGKKRIHSSNKDALDLYLLINGNNRKYINYLLKKRNADNTRMFEVKDIIDMVRSAESKIIEQKANNSLYRASDAKAYYNHLYDSKVQQYGKVKNQKRINTKA